MLQQGSKELTETVRKLPAGPRDIPTGARKFQEALGSARKLPRNPHIGSFRSPKEASGGNQRLASGQVEYIWIKAAFRKAQVASQDIHGRPRETKGVPGPQIFSWGAFQQRWTEDTKQ
jgi:hypothetical protein